MAAGAAGSGSEQTPAPVLSVADGSAHLHVTTCVAHFFQKVSKNFKTITATYYHCDGFVRRKRAVMAKTI